MRGITLLNNYKYHAVAHACVCGVTITIVYIENTNTLIRIAVPMIVIILFHACFSTPYSTGISHLDEWLQLYEAAGKLLVGGSYIYSLLEEAGLT